MNRLPNGWRARQLAGEEIEALGDLDRTILDTFVWTDSSSFGIQYKTQESPSSSFVGLLVTLRATARDCEAGWTEDFWTKTNLLK